MIFKRSITLFFILLTGAAIAQQPLRKPLISSIEVFGGPGLSFNYGNKFLQDFNDSIFDNNAAFKKSYSIGLGVIKDFTEKVRLNLRLAYDNKGIKSQLVTNSLTINSEYSYSYLSLSLVPQIHLNNSKSLTAGLGFYYSQLREVNGYERLTNGQESFANEFPGKMLRGFRDDGSVHTIGYLPGLQAFKDYDLGLILQVSYSIPVTEKGAIFIQLQDNYGIKNISKENPVLENPSEKNHTLLLLIGFNYRLY